MHLSKGKKQITKTLLAQEAALTTNQSCQYLNLGLLCYENFEKIKFYSLLNLKHFVIATQNQLRHEFNFNCVINTLLQNSPSLSLLQISEVTNSVFEERNITRNITQLVEHLSNIYQVLGSISYHHIKLDAGTHSSPTNWKAEAGSESHLSQPHSLGYKTCPNKKQQQRKKKPNR